MSDSGGGDPREGGAVRRKGGAKAVESDGTGSASGDAARGATRLQSARVVLS